MGKMTMLVACIFLSACLQGTDLLVRSTPSKKDFSKACMLSFCKENIVNNWSDSSNAASYNSEGRYTKIENNSRYGSLLTKEISSKKQCTVIVSCIARKMDGSAEVKLTLGGECLRNLSTEKYVPHHDSAFMANNVNEEFTLTEQWKNYKIKLNIPSDTKTLLVSVGHQHKNQKGTVIDLKKIEIIHEKSPSSKE